jgi:hypothetical protein
MNADSGGHMPFPGGETGLDAARRRFVRSKVDAGWKQHNGWIVHPQDTEIGFYVDPKSRRLAFSPRMVAQVKQDGSAEEMFKLIRRDGEQAEWGNEP